jgi:hypothetical protein
MRAWPDTALGLVPEIPNYFTTSFSVSNLQKDNKQLSNFTGYE